jgi:microcin C transport system substrate-binding protein
LKAVYDRIACADLYNIVLQLALPLMVLVSTQATAIENETLRENRGSIKIVSGHGLALYGDPKYPANFSHFEWTNKQAPKGGTLRLMGFGTFDSLNPYTLKGTSPFNTPGMFMYGFTELNESLMIGSGSYSPSGDEAQTAYGLLAETIRYPEDFRWVEFDIRPQAAFHDGHKVDAEDVVFSFTTLIEDGHPRFQQTLLDIADVEARSKQTVRFNLKPGAGKQAVFRAGEMPVLPKHFWEELDFATSSQVTPLLSGPYKIGKVDLGSRVELQRVEDFWGSTLNVYQGRYNFDTVSIDFYRDQSVAFEAFKSNEFDLFYDYTAKNWASAYDFPAVQNQEVIKEEIAHQIPSGTQGFFFNTRRDLFKDIRVRQAITELFDFEWVNNSLFHNAYERNLSYFPNSRYAASGIPSGNELALLEPFRTQLPKTLFTEPFSLTQTKGDGNIRNKLRLATALLREAGWVIQEGKLRHKETGKSFEFEFIYRQAGLERIIMPFIKNLERVGITVSPRLVESAQYKARLDNFDFDMMTFVLSQGNAPSYEQRDYYHSSLKDVAGSQNYAGIAHPIIDALIEKLLDVRNEDELIATMRALDRVLMSQYYLVPNWHIGKHRLARWNKFGRPKTQTPFKLGTENWWLEPAQD